MACFLVPAAEAVITTITAKVISTREKSHEALPVSPDRERPETAEKLPFSRKLKWLGNLLWGGSTLLAFEHVWHGEVVPWFPFLTAASDSAAASEMLHEMATVGVTMTAIVTAVWLGMLVVSNAIEKRAVKAAEGSEKRGIGA